jgi:octanoyl-[GcvH]:protein N-octanoyltransferase
MAATAPSGTRTIRLVRDGYPEPPALDTAVSRAILQLVSEGAEPETLRLHRPSAILAFGPKDRLASGYQEAVLAAREQGFASIQRLAGGRAAVFHEGTIAFSWAIPDPEPRRRILARFEEVAAIVARALRSLGIDARVGEVAGEYCPGEHSVNARGATKLVGVGQRLVAQAAHVGGVVVVSGANRVRDVLVPVYTALGLPWDPATVGSLQDERPGISWADAAGAILEAFAERYELVEDHLSPATLTLARGLVSEHAVEL